MSTHTPGPFVVKDSGGPSVFIESATDCSACAINARGYQIAEVFNAGPECGQEECRAEAMANAQLFAAAPDMRAALSAVLDAWSFICEGPQPAPMRHAIRKARAALAMVRTR